MWGRQMRSSNAGETRQRSTAGLARRRRVRGAVFVAALTWTVAGGTLWADTLPLFEDDFEGEAQWSLTGDWRFKSSSACLPNDLGYASPSASLVFDFGTDCAYRSNRLGYATMTSDVAIPITTPVATLVWWDFVGAEVGADYYFIEVSTDGGATWPYEIYRDSQDETFWDQESVDLSSFVGQSIRLRFGFTSDATVGNFGWYIDDVSIEGELLPPYVSALAVRDATLAEGEAGTSDMSFTLEISPPNADSITIEHSTVDGAGLAGLDYIATSGPITIPPNTSSMTVPVEIIGDPFFEPDETFLLTIQNASYNAHITLGTAVGTIIDDEQVTHIYEEDFEPRTGSLPWSVNFEGSAPAAELWHLADDSACIPSEDAFVSATHAMAFTDETGCTYYEPAGITGIVELTNPVTIPAEALSAQLSFHDYLEVFYDGEQAQKTTAYAEVKQFGSSDPWLTLLEISPDEPSLANIVYPWSEHTLNLDAFIGMAVVVRFRFVVPPGEAPHDATGWFIDDFKISYGAPSRKAYTVVVKDAAADEGNGGTTMLHFPVDILPPTEFDGPPDLVPIVIGYKTSQLTVGDVVTIPDPYVPNATLDLTLGVEDVAVADDDYIVEHSQITIPAGATSAVISVLMASEDTPEEDEYFKLLLHNVSTMVHLVNREALGTIVNDDYPSDLTVALENGITDTELSEGVGMAQFKITLDPKRTVPITIDYATVDGTAVSGDGLDFKATSGAVTFPPNTTEATFDVIVFEDTFYEDTAATPPPELDPEDRGREAFSILLTTDSTYAETNVSTPFTILDNDPLGDVPVLNVYDFPMATEGSCPTISAVEPCDSFNQARFLVDLNRPNTEEVVIEYTTVDGTATAGEDYEETSGTLTFDVSSVPQQAVITVDILADRTIEQDETFHLMFFNPSESVLVDDNAGTATIFDDDYLRTAFGVDGVSAPGAVARTAIDLVTEPDPYLIDPPVNLTSCDFRGYEYDRLFGWESTTLTNDLIEIDLVGGAVTKTPLPPSGGGQWSGFAWDHTKGLAYASTTIGAIYTVHLDAVSADPQCMAGGLNIAAIAVHPTSGRIYAVEINGTDARVYLHVIVPGEWTFGSPIELLGLAPGTDPAMDRYWDCDFDDTNGELYICAHDGATYAVRKLDVDDIA